VAFTTLRHLATVQEAVHGLASPPPIVLLGGSAPGVVSLDSQAETSRTAPLPPCPAVRSDPAVILYTSGTTSDPKGVVLTHGNWLAEMEAALRCDSGRGTVLAILPLFHALAAGTCCCRCRRPACLPRSPPAPT
jgi:long-chain acyl-CoA synthetase